MVSSVPTASENGVKNQLGEREALAGPSRAHCEPRIDGRSLPVDLAKAVAVGGYKGIALDEDGALQRGAQLGDCLTHHGAYAGPNLHFLAH
jgi:hypothetical protein